MLQWLSLLFLAAALAAWPSRPWTLRRPRDRIRKAAEHPNRRSLVAGGSVLAAGLVLSPTAWAWALAAGMVAGCLVRVTGRRTSVPATGATLAVVCDLWAAGLDSGLGVGPALTASLSAMNVIGPGSSEPDLTLGRLIRVAGLLQVGAEPARAWLAADDDQRLLPMAAAAQRSQVAGADMAGTIRQQSDLIRSTESGAAQRRASRAGVLMTAPLALCFLPSFICLGLAPVVIALIDTLDIGF